MRTPIEQIYQYYAHRETKYGYKFFLNDAKHLGYYPLCGAGITESEAQKSYHEQIANVLDLMPNEKVLDAGCGRGVAACYLAEKYNVKVTGVDIVDFEIGAADSRRQRLHLGDKVDFQIMDYSDLDFPDDHFDAVYANETLSHTPNLGKVLREFYRVLKPGGRLTLFEYVLAEETAFNKTDLQMLEFIIGLTAMAGLKQFRKDSVLVLLAEISFVNIQRRNITANVAPSFYRLHQIARLFYPIIKFFGLRYKFPNATSATELWPMVERGLIFFYIFSARKPK